MNFRKQTKFFKDASTGEAHKYEKYVQMLCNRNDGKWTWIPMNNTWKMLFEDPEFPASNHLLVDDNQQFVISYFGRTRFDSNSIQWKRPHEIISNPQMFVGDADRFDINQGEIGNCWFLAAVANFAGNKKCFNRVVPQDQDFNDRDYQGMFRFRFWRFGEWVEVVIDDRLPTRNGKLIYLRSVEKNEFWGALLEKAYAKLHGSYRALEGGLTIGNFNYFRADFSTELTEYR